MRRVQFILVLTRVLAWFKVNVQEIREQRLLLKRWVKKHKGAPLCQKAMDWREALGWVLGTEGPLSERLAKFNAYWEEQGCYRQRGGHG